MDNIPLITPAQARALSDEPWYAKKIKEAADKNFYSVTLECKTMQEASIISAVLADAGYKTDISKQTMFYGVIFQLSVSW